MMKKITLLFFVLFAFIIYSCNESQLDSEESIEIGKKGQDKNDNNGNNGNSDDLPFIGPAFFESIEDEPKYCGEPVECTFKAGQNIDAGLVTVSNDDDFLYVKVFSKAGFQDVDENIKMWIGLTAPDRRPQSGQFPYKVTETGDTHIFKIELSTLPEWDECGKQYVIIVHGDVLTEKGNAGSGETAYGGCELAEGNPWWAYMEYTTQCCEEEEMELGWLYKYGSNSRNTCFSNTQSDVYGISARFPYANNYKYGKTFPVYGNIKENCNIEEIEIIGNLTLTLLDWDKSTARLVLHFEPEQGYDVDKYYIYIGWINPVTNMNNGVGVFDSSLASKIIEVDIEDGDKTIDVYGVDWTGNKAAAEWYQNLEQYYISAMFEYQSN